MNIYFNNDNKILNGKLLYNFKTLRDIVCLKISTPPPNIKGYILFSRNHNKWHCEDVQMENLYPEAIHEISLQLQNLFAEIDGPCISRKN
jgi:hypothetical protein